MFKSRQKRLKATSSGDQTIWRQTFYKVNSGQINKFAKNNVTKFIFSKTWESTQRI